MEIQRAKNYDLLITKQKAAEEHVGTIEILVVRRGGEGRMPYSCLSLRKAAEANIDKEAGTNSQKGNFQGLV